jgi:hypothetical protein
MAREKVIHMHIANLLARIRSGCFVLLMPLVLALHGSANVAAGSSGPLTVTITPKSADVQANGGSQNFTATVQNDKQNGGVTWSLAGTGCSGTACGSLSSAFSGSGVAITYAAPASVPSPATVTLAATSVSNKQKMAVATITVISGGAQGISVTISPKRGALVVGQTLSVTATSNDPVGVQWSASGGSFSSASSMSGVAVAFTAPASAGIYTITATSLTRVDISTTISIGVTDLAGVYTYHNDLTRDGVNGQEYSLTPALVNTSSFGKLFSCKADGAIYAQPLWVANVGIGGGTHNVIIAATMRDSVYAFDADASPCVTYWQKTLIPPEETYGNDSDVNSQDIHPDIGILGTPVIDSAAGTIYLVAKSKTTGSGTYHQRLHALRLADGSEQTGGPVEVGGSVSVPGNCEGGDSVAFNALKENQRAGLALVDGNVYVAWASHGDSDPYHGWILGYSTADLAPAGVFNTSPNAAENLGYCRAGIWMAGGAPAADSINNVVGLYVLTGNGIWDGKTAFGDSVLKLSTSGGLSLADWFTPYNQLSLDGNDTDVGSGGAAVLVDNGGAHPNLLIGGGKEGVLYILDRTKLGNNHPSDNNQIVQTLAVTGGTFSTPAFWQNTLFHFGSGSSGKAYALDSSTSTFNASWSSETSASFNFPGATPSVSSNGSSNGIVWVIDSSNYGTRGHKRQAAGPAVLYAFAANNLGTELWNSGTVALDAAGNAVKFTVPTVANGKVYVGTRGNDDTVRGGSVLGTIDVYGLKSN